MDTQPPGSRPPPPPTHTQPAPTVPTPAVRANADQRAGNPESADRPARGQGQLPKTVVLRWAFYLLACVAVVVGGTASARPAQQRPSFASESSELVVLPVIVSDRQGKLVADFLVDRFTVYANRR